MIRYKTNILSILLINHQVYVTSYNDLKVYIIILIIIYIITNYFFKLNGNFVLLYLCSLVTLIDHSLDLVLVLISCNTLALD